MDKSLALPWTVVALLLAGLFYLGFRQHAPSKEPESDLSVPETRDDWNITVLDGETREPKADGKVWRLKDGETTCYLFIQRNGGTWLPTMSCVK